MANYEDKVQKRTQELNKGNNADTVEATEGKGVGYKAPKLDLASTSNTATIQKKKGKTVGRFCINSNVVGEGLTAGHAWLSYEPIAGSKTTYGTWGNKEPIGLHRDLELSYSPKAKRCADVDKDEAAAINSFASANNAWSLTNNCASFAARGWKTVIGEHIPYRSVGIPNPSALGKGINALGSEYVPTKTKENEKSSSSL